MSQDARKGYARTLHECVGSYPGFDSKKFAHQVEIGYTTLWLSEGKTDGNSDQIESAWGAESPL